MDRDMLKKLKFNDSQSWLALIWIALDRNRHDFNDAEWDEVCTAMAWIKEELNYVENERFIKEN